MSPSDLAVYLNIARIQQNAKAFHGAETTSSPFRGKVLPRFECALRELNLNPSTRYNYESRLEFCSYGIGAVAWLE